MRKSPLLLRLFFLLIPLVLFSLSCLRAASGECVEFRFNLPTTKVQSFAREIEVSVQVPDGRVLVLPAFTTDGAQAWAVRIRKASHAGEYRLLSLAETTEKGRVVLQVPEGLKPVVSSAARRPSGGITISRKDARVFSFENGESYYPLGMNVAFIDGKNFEGAFAMMEKAGLNWSRVWMCHWGGTNMEWREGDEAIQPELGTLDLKVAERWDKIVESAENHGIFFQLVLQHHGQLSTQVNPNWSRNPWNKAKGGFLEKPSDFFRNPLARDLFKRKLRYTVARWGYSTSIMAWEFFNEVMFTDAVRIEKDEKVVVDWHREMSAYLRALDPYRHLITTSTDEVDSPIYASLDYLQPHRYAIDMIRNVTGFDAPVPADKPVFYGEAGDDWIEAGQENKNRGYTLDPITWASLAGGTLLPAQQWYHDRLLPTGRANSLQHAASFARLAGLDRFQDWSPIDIALHADVRVPLRIEAASYWQKRPVVRIPLRFDGVEAAGLRHVPHFLVGTENQAAEGFPDRVSFLYTSEKPLVADIQFTQCGIKGARVVLCVDGKCVQELEWLPLEPTASATKLPGQKVSLTLPSGEHELLIRNFGEDTVRFGSLEVSREAPLVRAIGKQRVDAVVAFLWNPKGVYTQGAEAVDAVLQLPNLKAGKWRVQWWGDSGRLDAPETVLDHRGGVLEVRSPKVSRFAALLLERVEN